MIDSHLTILTCTPSGSGKTIGQVFVAIDAP